jgi:hypothetical protein
MNEEFSKSEATDISDWFWSIIEQSEGSRDKLRLILRNMDKNQIYRFQDEFLEASIQLQDEPFNKYISPEISEDGEQDISNWVVSQGRKFYEFVWKNPSKIPYQIDIENPNNLFGIADEVYEEKFGEELDV